MPEEKENPIERREPGGGILGSKRWAKKNGGNLLTGLDKEDVDNSSIFQITEDRDSLRGNWPRFQMLS
jgi:hypothetical protein